METLDNALFLWLNAPQHPNAAALTLAIFLAERLIWAVPLLIGIGWLRGNPGTRKAMLVASVSGLFGLLVNQLIALTWTHPRPFMIGLGHTFIAHAADSSFPSDHLTLWWGVAFSFLRQDKRKAGAAMALMGVPIAWARIYVGVHFPLDMLGAAAVAAFAAWLTLRQAHWYVAAAYGLAASIHRRLFRKLIGLGWIRE